MIAMEIFSLGALPVDGGMHDVHNGMQFADQVTLDTSDADPPPRPKFELIVGAVDVDPPPPPKRLQEIVGVVDNDPPPPPKR